MSPETKSSVPVGAGTVAGLVTALSGYLVLFLVHGDRLERSFAGINTLLELLGTDGIAAWKVAGWLYFNLHHTPISVSVSGRSRVTHTLVGGDGASALWYLLPPILLVLAGAVVARYADARDVRSGALAGVSIVPAVLLAALVGGLATRATVGDATVGPELATGVLLAGLVYPAVLGGVGGVLGAVTR